jgi:hypothetical protein
MPQLAIYTNAKNLTKLLRKPDFPPLPTEWQNLEGAKAWHENVAKVFDKLRRCDLDGFREICICLEEELEVRNHPASRRSPSDFWIAGGLPNHHQRASCRQVLGFRHIPEDAVDEDVYS